MSLKKRLLIGGILLITVLTLFWTRSNMRKIKIPGDTKVEVGLKAVNSDRFLKINTIACRITDEYFRSGLTRTPGVYIQYPQYSFTGNINELYYCPDRIDGHINNLAIRAAPIGGYENLQEKFNGVDYLNNLVTRPPLFAEFMGEKNNIQIYRGREKIRILLKGFSKDTHAMLIEHNRIHRGDIESTFLYSYDITTMISNDFMAKYKVNSTEHNEVIRGGEDFTPFPIDAQFAREFHHVLKTEGELGILDHPEIIQKFIDNNERVIKHIKSISREESDPDGESYIKIVRDNESV